MHLEIRRVAVHQHLHRLDLRPMGTDTRAKKRRYGDRYGDACGGVRVRVQVCVCMWRGCEAYPFFLDATLALNQ